MSRSRVVRALRIRKEDIPALEILTSRLIQQSAQKEKLPDNVKWNLNLELMVMHGWIGEYHFCDLVLPLERAMSAVKESRNWRKMIMNTGYDKAREEQLMAALEGHRIRA